YFEFDDLTTPDPSDEASKEFSNLAYLAVSRVILCDNSSPPLSPASSLLLSSNDLATATSPQQLAELYQRATIDAVKAWTHGNNTAPPQTAWLAWLNRKSLLDSDPNDPTARKLAAAITEMRNAENSVHDHARAIGMVDGTGLDENVFIRGNHKTPGEIVSRRFLQALGGSDKARFTSGSGRLELAR